MIAVWDNIQIWQSKMEIRNKLKILIFKLVWELVIMVNYKSKPLILFWNLNPQKEYDISLLLDKLI